MSHGIPTKREDVKKKMDENLQKENNQAWTVGGDSDTSLYLGID